jgi:hypothetical protein
MHNETNWNTVSQDGWHMIGTMESFAMCGTWLTKGCLNVKRHGNKIHQKSRGKVFIHHYPASCNRADCKICYEFWLNREASRATKRIMHYCKKTKKKPIHAIISVPGFDHFKDFKYLKQRSRELLDEAGIVGGSMMFHPFRRDENNWWYYSPHFHLICFGWVEGTKEITSKTKYVIKNLGVRMSQNKKLGMYERISKGVFATFRYQLGHAGIKQRTHAVTWFGSTSYAKLKMPKEEKSQVCPMCYEDLVNVSYVGTNESLKPPNFKEFKGWLSPVGWVVATVKKHSFY